MGVEHAKGIRQPREAQENATGASAEEFRRFVEEVRPRLVRYFGLATGDVHQAEDLTQTVLMHLFTSDDFSVTHPKARGYAWVTAKNVFIDYKRSGVESLRGEGGNGVRRQAELVPGPRHDEPDAFPIAKETEKAVLDSLARLPEPEQEILRLSFWEGLPQTRIRERVEFPKDGFYRVVWRAYEELRKVRDDIF